MQRGANPTGAGRGLLDHYYSSRTPSASDYSDADVPFSRVNASAGATRRQPPDLRMTTSESDYESGTMSNGYWAAPPHRAAPSSSAPTMLSAADKAAYVRQLERLEEDDSTSERSPHRGGGGIHRHHVSTANRSTHLQEVRSPLQPADSQDGAAHTLADRTTRWRDRVNSSTQALRRDLADLKERECTFRPAINRSRPSTKPSNQLDVTVSDDSEHYASNFPKAIGHDTGYAAVASANKADVHSRLYANSGSILAKRARAAEEREENEAAGCTFKPALVKAAWAQCVQPRYLDPVHRSDSAVGADHDESHGHSYAVLRGFGGGGAASVSYGQSAPRGSRSSAGPMDDACTFAPVTNASQSPYIAEYLRQPVHERLSRPHTPKRAEAEATTTPRRQLKPAEMAEFQTRLQKDIETRKQRAASRKRQVELEAPTFKPHTNRYHEDLTAEERDALVRARQKKLEAEKRRILEETLTKPKAHFASNKSRELLGQNPNLNRPLLDRYKEAAEQRRCKIEAARREKEEAELRQCQRDPSVVIARPPPDASKPVVSELAKVQRAAKSPTAYVEYLRKEEDKRRKAMAPAVEEAEQRRREAEAECTYHPKVDEAPEYIQQIARARSLSRQGRSPSAGSRQHYGTTSTGTMVFDPTPVRRY
jgi:hypothetical protein